ncbi:MAG TPA: DegT/DnrJ/EryC1/StrS family aminotransferase, partial [Clostridiaceae bacterium]|nr:DegT/DnrJ/EryC1/StrS family aminotransferase [Clostridiaceae bacterium]
KEIEYSAHMLPQTDDILERAVNISVGVVDDGLGSAFGININSTDDEIKAVADKISEIMKNL